VTKIYTIFDTETTQLINNSLMPMQKQPRIVEFCGIKVDATGKRYDELEYICNPGITMPDEAAKITGLTAEKLRDYPPIDGRLDETLRFLESCDGVVAHNFYYDYSVVNFEVQRKPGASIVWPKERICTVEATEHFKGFRLNLMGLHEYLFGVGFEQAHRARNDVEALAKCFVEMLKRGLI
jgi:DNA polymerase-3 subunit epsilon